MFGASVTWLDNEQFLSCEPRYTQYFDCYYEPSLCRSKDAMKCTQCVLHESDPSLKGFNKRFSTFNNLALVRIFQFFDYTSLRLRPSVELEYKLLKNLILEFTPSNIKLINYRKTNGISL